MLIGRQRTSAFISRDDVLTKEPLLGIYDLSNLACGSVTLSLDPCCKALGGYLASVGTRTHGVDVQLKEIAYAHQKLWQVGSESLR